MGFAPGKGAVSTSTAVTLREPLPISSHNNTKPTPVRQLGACAKATPSALIPLATRKQKDQGAHRTPGASWVLRT